MSQLSTALRQAAEKNHGLLAELASTDHAPGALKRNRAYISDLQSQIANTDKELSRLHTVTEDERKAGADDHLKYRDSNVKRWAYKLQGGKGKDKFSSRQEKEEREFLDAWQAERSAKESREELERALEQAQKDQSQLEGDAQRHDKAQSELDRLYASIFNGPTPDVPGEDQAEQAVQQSKANLDQYQSQYTSEERALAALANADKSLSQAYTDIEAALRRSGRDMFGGGTFTDMMERDALASSQNNINATLRHMSSAQSAQPAIQPLKEINIDQGHFFSDVMFDNIFTDMAQHERIQGSEAEMRAAIGHLRHQAGEQRGRVETAGRNVKQASEDLEAARKELQRIRAEAFARFAGDGNAEVAPPAYSAQ